MNKTEVKMNQPVYLRLSIQGMSKIVMYEYWYDYTKPKHGDNAKLCYTDTDSLAVHVKPEDVHADLTGDVEKRFDTSNYTAERPLPIWKNKKLIDLMKDELNERIMKEFAAL